jgi:hypothetical protein
MDETTGFQLAETTEKDKKTWKDFIPRKIAGGIAAMYLIWKAGIELKDVTFWLYFLTIVCMTLLGVIAIWTHYLLERGPKQKKPSDELRVTNHELHPEPPK